MLRFLLRFFALIGFLVVGTIAVVLYLAVRHEPAEPAAVVLSLDLSQPLAEADGGGIDGVIDRKTTLRDILDGLERAESDPKVKGLVARFGDNAWGYAQGHDLRQAVERFRASGKFALAYADTFGEGQSAALALSVAAAFDEIWMQPLGMLSVNWPLAEVPFIRGTLDLLGIAPQMEKREAYKSFADTFTETGLTPQNREMLQSITASLSDTLVQAIARGRKLPADGVRKAMDRAPLSDTQALEARLIDRLGYRDEVLDEAQKRAGDDAELVTPLDYLDMAGGPHDSGTTVALIHAIGEIHSGDGEAPFDNGLDGSAERLVRAFDEAADDDDVKAILFRIDSPGGAVTASETIRRAVAKARQAGKPVVVSMGDMAGSGGYWIAMEADRILASPGTLTGSIGVVTGKLPLTGAFAKLGVTWERVAGGPNADFWSPIQPMSDSQRQQMAAVADSIYDSFLRKVAAARHMTLDRVRAAAQGRVWTGAQAIDLGLVDALGSQRDALAAVRELARLPANAPVELVEFPQPGSTWDQLAALLRHDNGFAGLLQTARLGARLEPVVSRLLPLAAAQQHPGPAVRMPAVGTGSGGRTAP